MKKILSLSLVLIMVMALAGCGHTEGDSLGPGVDIVEKEVISPEPDTKDMNEETVYDWGITLTVTDITSTGLTIVCEQVDGEQQGELQTGSPYSLEVFKDSSWQSVSYLPQEYDVAWTAEAWSVSLNDTTEWTVDWEWLYGELPSGTYRIGKSVMDWIEAGNYEEQTYYAEFEIE